MFNPYGKAVFGRQKAHTFISNPLAAPLASSPPRERRGISYDFPEHHPPLNADDVRKIIQPDKWNGREKWLDPKPKVCYIFFIKKMQYI